MRTNATHAGTIHSAEFLREGDSEDRPAGTYVTIRLDDENVAISAGRAEVTWLPVIHQDT